MPVYSMESEKVDGKYYTAFTYQGYGKPDRYFTARLLPEMREKADAGDVEAMFYVGMM